MRAKKAFSFNEEKDAEKIVMNGFPNGKIDYAGMYLVAKYFRQTLSYGEIRLERKLIEFCKEQDHNFNPVIESESIKKWVRSAMKYGLRKIDSIKISMIEMDFLKSIEPTKDRKIMFCTLVLSKAMKMRNTTIGKKDYKVSNKYYLHYRNLADVVRLSKLTNISEVALLKILHKYKEYFTFYHPEKELIRLEFIDIETDPEDMAEIADLNNAIDFYNLWLVDFKPIPARITHCVICGDKLEKSSNRQKYCPSCAEDVRREQKAEEMRKRRA